MKRILATAGIAGIALIGVTAPASAGDKDGDKKVSICHATGSESNPYVHITVSENAANGHDGHAGHAGDLIPAPASGCPDGGGKGGGKDDDDDGNGHGQNKMTICHATGSDTNPYVIITIPEKAWLHGHKDGHNGRADIYPVPAGGCEAEEKPEKPPAEKPPVETPPVETPPAETPPAETPPAETPPAVTPPGETPPAVIPPAQPPAGAAAAPIGAAAAVPVVNRGFNAQTAAGSQPDTGVPAWFGGLAAFLGATGLIALRQRGRLQDPTGSK